MTSSAGAGRWWLATLAAAAIAVRLGMLASGPWQAPANATTPDSGRYLVLAENLLRYQTFGKAEEEGRYHTDIVWIRQANGTLPPADANGLRPEAFRTPGYPAFIALIRVVTGDVRAVLVAQCLLGAIGVLLVGAVARDFGLTPAGSLIAAGLWALHPALVVHDVMFMSEALFSFLGLLSIWCAARRAPHGLAAAGLLVGLATLVRPIGLLYLPAVLAAAASRGRLRRRLAVLIVGLAVAPALLWSARNHASGEGFRLSTVSAVNLLYYTTAYTLSEAASRDWADDWIDRVDELSRRLAARVGPGEDVFSASSDLAAETLARQPAALLSVQAKSWLKLMVGHSLADVYKAAGASYTPSGLLSSLVLGESPGAGVPASQLLAASAWLSLNAAVVLCAVMGVVRAFRFRRTPLVVAVAATVVLCAAATGSVGLERFRLPMMAALFLGAGASAGLRPAPPGSHA